MAIRLLHPLAAALALVAAALGGAALVGAALGVGAVALLLVTGAAAGFANSGST